MEFKQNQTASNFSFEPTTTLMSTRKDDDDDDDGDLDVVPTMHTRWLKNTHRNCLHCVYLYTRTSVRVLYCSSLSLFFFVHSSVVFSLPHVFWWLVKFNMDLCAHAACAPLYFVDQLNDVLRRCIHTKRTQYLKPIANWMVLFIRFSANCQLYTM